MSKEKQLYSSKTKPEGCRHNVHLVHPLALEKLYSFTYAGKELFLTFNFSCTSFPMVLYIAAALSYPIRHNARQALHPLWTFWVFLTSLVQNKVKSVWPLLWFIQLSWSLQFSLVKAEDPYISSKSEVYKTKLFMGTVNSASSCKNSTCKNASSFHYEKEVLFF